MPRKKFNRQNEDYILTDLLPVEKSDYYTHYYFYEYILNSKKFTKQIKEEFSIKSSSMFDSYLHAAPLKFKIVNKEGFRNISLLNPLSILEAYFFIEFYGDDILNIIQKKRKYSLRVPYRISSLIYKHKNRKNVMYSNDEEKNQLLFTLETSGSFYKHKPFKMLRKFFNDRRYLYNNDNFKYLLHFDIERFFDSIYTHTFTWLITNNSLDAIKHNSSNSLYSNADTFLQNINGAKTNGIVIGPEISRLMSEFLLTHIEDKIYYALENKNINVGQDYNLFRFIDDYYLYTNDKKLEIEIYNIIETSLDKFHLGVNKRKTIEYETITLFNNWIDGITKIIYDFDDIFSSDNKKQFNYGSLKNKIIKLVQDSDEQRRIVSYLLTVIVNKVEIHNEADEVVELSMTYLDLITLIFFLHSMYPCYVSTKKIIRICTLLLQEKYEDKIKKEYIERAIDRFKNKIFTQYPSDWVDLIIFCGSYNIRLSKYILDEFVEKQILTENEIEIDPRLLAGLIIYKKTTNNLIAQEFEKVIKSNLERIHSKDFFKDPQSWWVFIFCNCPYTELDSIKLDIKTILAEVVRINSSTPNCTSKSMKEYLLKYLEDNNGFIIWDFNSEDYYKKFYFYTRSRTLFNADVLDPFELSW